MDQNGTINMKEGCREKNHKKMNKEGSPMLASSWMGTIHCVSTIVSKEKENVYHKKQLALHQNRGPRSNLQAFPFSFFLIFFLIYFFVHLQSGSK
jgi:hypothetical protein